MSWRLQLNSKDTAAAKDTIITSSCPPEDDVRKVKPFQVVRNNEALGKGGGGATSTSKRSFYIYIPPQLCNSLPRLLSEDSPPTQQQQQQFNNNNLSLRVILAIHGYSGRPLQEIRKWHDAAVSLNSIIIAPQGTLTEEKLGWNAIDCCGDPVINELNDVDFITNGVVEVFLNVIWKHINHYKNANDERVNVIATGFSNGGFMTSLLGLSPYIDRPSWLVGIVPTGGYQYNTKFYEGPSIPHSLPMMSHHGGRDSVVIPDGCCALPDNSSQSNCVFNIGVKQRTCTSVQSAFEMWSHINGCNSTVLDEDIVNNRRVKKVDKSREEPVYNCWKGKDCIEPTNFCLWNNQGHAWGFQFPGIQIAESWMEEIFHRAETQQSSNIIEDVMRDGVYDDEFSITYASAISYVNQGSKKGRLLFVASFTLLLAVFFCIASNAPQKFVHFLGRKRRKRKTSEDEIGSGRGDHIALQKLVTSNDQ